MGGTGVTDLGFKTVKIFAAGADLDAILALPDRGYFR
jgi:hypothetical protein